MKNFFILTNFFIKSYFKEKFDDDKSLLNNLIKILIALAIVSFFIFSTVKLYSSLSELKVETILVPLILLLDSLVCMLFGLFLILSNFSFSSDNEALLSLPIDSKTIFLSKLAFIEITLLPISLLIIPFLFTYGILSRAPITFYVYSIVASVLVPMIPILYGTIISLLLTRLTVGKKNKNFIQTCFTVVTLLLGIGVMYFTINISTSTNFLTSIINSSSSYKLNFIDFIFPSNILLTKALIFSNSFVGFKSLIYTIIFSLIALFLTTMLCKNLYLKILFTASDIEKSEYSTAAISYNASSSTLKTLVKRDFLILLRNSLFFLHSFAMIFIFIFIIFTLVPLYNSMGLFVNIENDYILILMFSIYLPGLFAGWNATASSSFSREGQYLPLLLHFPITNKEIIYSKIIISLIINGFIIIIPLGLLLFIDVPFIVFLLISLAVITFSIFIILISICNDISAPNVKWIYEKDLFKNNYRLFKSVLYSFSYLVVFVALCKILKLISLSDINIFYILSCLSIFTNIILMISYYNKINSKFDILHNV